MVKVAKIENVGKIFEYKKYDTTKKQVVSENFEEINYRIFVEKQYLDEIKNQLFNDGYTVKTINSIVKSFDDCGDGNIVQYNVKHTKSIYTNNKFIITIQTTTDDIWASIIAKAKKK